MTLNKKNAAEGFGTPEASKHSIRPFIKAVIVHMALRGILPVKLAEWMIQRGGLRHV